MVEKLKVLIMDDDPSRFRQLEGDLCPKRTGVEIFTARTPEEARQILEIEDIGTAFIDRYGPYPELEDLGVPFLMANATRFPETALYLHSSENDPEVTALLIGAGAKGFIDKSSDPIDYVLAIGFTTEEAREMGYRGER
ncbi:MAG: hypothetical protein ABH817_00820 [archaeon]